MIFNLSRVSFERSNPLRLGHVLKNECHSRVSEKKKEKCYTRVKKKREMDRVQGKMIFRLSNFERF